MFCSNCGSQVNPADKFCGTCGSSVAASQGAPAPQPQRPAAPPRPAPAAQQGAVSNAPKEKKKIPLWIKIVGGVFIAIVFFVWVILGSTAGVAKTVEKHINYLKKQDLRSAYDLTTSRDFRDATSYDQFVKIIRRFPSLSNVRKISINERAVNSDGVGTIKGKVTDASGASVPIIYTLVKEGGEFKIINFTVNPQQ